jgi:hypothetical protein
MRKLLIGTSALMLCFQLSATASDEVPTAQFAVRQESASLGSNVRQDIVKSEVLPLDKQYADLTVEQKKSLKSEYEKMSDADEPPYPTNGLLPVFKSPAQAHEKSGLKNSGKIVLYIPVDSQGNPKSVSASESPDPDLTKVTAIALMTQKYKPAVCNGTPCAMEFPFRAKLLAPGNSALMQSVDAIRTLATPGQ